MVILVSRTCQLRVTHPCATLLSITAFRVRLACVRHAASVRSEPGSNSPKIFVLSLAAESFKVQRADVLSAHLFLLFESRSRS